jgi:putative SOS response-associated peptidase YedK
MAITKLAAMCGRFSIISSYGEMIERFQAKPPKGGLFENRYNIAPGQKVLVVPNRQPRIFDYYHWGLLPSWAKEPKKIKRMINARAETIFEKPFFAGSIRSKRCLVPADGFYEWKREGQQKTPFRIQLKGNKLFAFAGIYDVWQGREEEIKTFSLITTAANSLVANVHHRMPVILRSQQEAVWLDPNTDEDEIKKMLVPFADEKMEMHQISKAVNNPQNDDPRIIQPI